MYWITNKNCYGYFGNADDNLYDAKNLHYDLKKFTALQNKIAKKNNTSIIPLFFLKQTHSSDVFVLNNTVSLKDTVTAFKNEGDSIITREKNIGIGVVTADCLPIFLYDSEQDAIGVIHAGWRGLSKKIITATIKKMHSTFNTNPSKLTAYLGPSAGICCYEVQSDFLNYFSSAILETGVIETRDEHIFFNAKKSAIDELLENDVMHDSINTENHVCTMCTPGFCSFRQQKKNSGRQPSFIYLE